MLLYIILDMINLKILKLLRFLFKVIFLMIAIFTINACKSNNDNNSKANNFIIPDKALLETPSDLSSDFIDDLVNSYSKLKLSKSINTKQNEYYPVPFNNGEIIYFVGMDRTGQFSTKIDFTSSRNYGGEDIWVSERKYGIYTEATPMKELNDNSHQSITGIYGSKLIVYGGYEETYQVEVDENFYNGDIFTFDISNNKLQHLGQPVNSIFFESDAYISADGNLILFVSDKDPLGPYNRKGYRYQNSFWGNTDIWISEKVEDYWTQPINLGSSINTEGAERTPYLSNDKTQLYFSSNGHPGYGNQDVFVSQRLDMNSWDSWSTPKNLGPNINQEFNDWCFNLYDNETKALMASETKLPFKVDATLLGDGGAREHNLRNGYDLKGKQSASFDYQCRSDIYWVDLNNENPIISIEDLLFDYNKYSISKNNLDLLDRMAELITENKKYNVKIVGHTDDSGSSAYNKDLSIKRAKVIFVEMIKRGVNKNRLSYEGSGEEAPLENNNNDFNRNKNRRVELIFYNK